MEFWEDDIVELVGETVSKKNVPVGSIGEVEHLYGGKHVEVVFRDPDGWVLASDAVAVENLRLVKRLERTA